MRTTKKVDALVASLTQVLDAYDSAPCAATVDDERRAADPVVDAARALIEALS